MDELFFEPIEGTCEQIDVLYSLLLERSGGISHRNIPSETEHKKFVLNSPYRGWFLVRRDCGYCGAFYLKEDNSIGVNLVNKYDVTDVANIIKFIETRFSPLEELKSVRAPHFHINVSATDKKLCDTLETLGKSKLQVTYVV